MEKDVMFVVPKNDAEAICIAEILFRKGVKFLVTSQGWGATWNNLEEEIRKEVEDFNGTVYGVELQGNGDELNPNCINIDHHCYSNDDRSNDLSSIEQVAELIDIELDPWYEAVSLNDKGYIPLMEKGGVSKQIIEKVRYLDRSAQGITPEQEQQAEEACKRKEVYGDLTIVRLAHSKCATVTDRLYGQYKNLLILSEDGESNYYGKGDICSKLQEKFKGWSGGNLPEYGFWGGYAHQDEIEEFVRKNA